MTTTRLSPSRAELQRKLLQMQLDSACDNFAAAMQRVGDHAQLIALLEGELSALECQAGWHRAGPSSRELAATVALGALAPLRTHLPFVSEDAAKQARAALTVAPE